MRCWRCRSAVCHWLGHYNNSCKTELKLRKKLGFFLRFEDKLTYKHMLRLGERFSRVIVFSYELYIFILFRS